MYTGSFRLFLTVGSITVNSSPAECSAQLSMTPQRQPMPKARPEHWAFPNEQHISSHKPATLLLHFTLPFKKIPFKGSHAFPCNLLTDFSVCQERAPQRKQHKTNLLSCPLLLRYHSREVPAWGTFIFLLLPRAQQFQTNAKKQLLFYNTHFGSFVSNQHFFL